jgi:hypothetical protein
LAKLFSEKSKKSEELSWAVAATKTCKIYDNLANKSQFQFGA